MRALERINNIVELRGALAGRPVLSHSSRSEMYYMFPLEIERLSGAVDTLNIVVRRELLESVELEEKQRVYVKGELRSFNNKSGVGNRLIITVFAQALELTDESDMNSVTLAGTICKPPTLRKTPMGREICDMMLAVNRRYGRSDYLPCIAWGRLAETASEFAVGADVQLTGRIQSRKYIKNENDVQTEKTAFEVSVAEIET
ncbi:MAG: single-stranded DNA-binding protein [Oscillospiraceae bacterium]